MSQPESPYYNEINFKKLKEKIRTNGSARIRIISDSMHPLIKVGEQLEISPNTQTLNPFDIIVFWDGEKLMAHYFWSFQNSLTTGEKEILTKSLKNPFDFDVPIAQSQILGKVKNKDINGWLKLKIKLLNIFRG